MHAVLQVYTRSYCYARRHLQDNARAQAMTAPAAATRTAAAIALCARAALRWI
jgi:hypothetical protein